MNDRCYTFWMMYSKVNPNWTAECRILIHFILLNQFTFLEVSSLSLFSSYFCITSMLVFHWRKWNPWRKSNTLVVWHSKCIFCCCCCCVCFFFFIKPKIDDSISNISESFGLQSFWFNQAMKVRDNNLKCQKVSARTQTH